MHQLRQSGSFLAGTEAARLHLLQLHLSMLGSLSCMLILASSHILVLAMPTTAPSHLHLVFCTISDWLNRLCFSIKPRLYLSVAVGEHGEQDLSRGVHRRRSRSALVLLHNRRRSQCSASGACP